MRGHEWPMRSLPRCARCALAQGRQPLLPLLLFEKITSPNDRFSFVCVGSEADPDRNGVERTKWRPVGCLVADWWLTAG